MASLSAKFQREGQSQSPCSSYFSSIRSIKDLIIAPGRDRPLSPLLSPVPCLAEPMDLCTSFADDYHDDGNDAVADRPDGT